MAPELSFIIIVWNSRPYLERCFNSIMASCRRESIDYEILVVDNGSRDGSAEMLREYRLKYPERFRYLLLERNSGTTYSRNICLRAARGEFLCVLDSDTEIASGSYRSLFDLISRSGRTGIVAPMLLLPDGTPQHSVKRFPTLWEKVGKIPGILLHSGTWNPDFYPEFPFEAEREVDSAISACWFFRRSLLDVVGELDEKIFYAPEDLDYSHRVRKAGYAILYYPGFRVLHHTQQVTHRKPFSRTTLRHLNGLLYLYRKHGGWLHHLEL